MVCRRLSRLHLVRRPAHGSRIRCAPSCTRIARSGALKLPVEFLHRDELSRKYGIHGADLPAVFRKTEGGLELWISQEEINRCRSLDELKRLVGQKRQAL